MNLICFIPSQRCGGRLGENLSGSDASRSHHRQLHCLFLSIIFSNIEALNTLELPAPRQPSHSPALSLPSALPSDLSEELLYMSQLCLCKSANAASIQAPVRHEWRLFFFMNVHVRKCAVKYRRMLTAEIHSAAAGNAGNPKREVRRPS